MWSWLKKFFSPLLRLLWSFLKAIFRGAVEIALAQLRELAIDVVREIAQDRTLITDEEKRNEAFARLKARAESRGIEAKDSIINLAIELTVSWLKNKGEL